MWSPTFSAQMHRAIDALPWPLARRLRARFPAPWDMYCVLNRRPLVVMIPEDWTANQGTWRVLFDDLRGERVHFLLLVRGPIEVNPTSYAGELRDAVAGQFSRYPKHTYTYLANNEAQVEIFRRAGVRHALINQNGIADERTFDVAPSAGKEFDAIYNAVMLPFKRHYLAASVKRLALITYLKAESGAYLDEVASSLSHASWLNFPGDRPQAEGFRRLSREEVAEQINRACVGLCLSAQEGAMFAAVEYLLCGLPVVTTPSIGGRDAIFDDDYVLTVADNEAAVAEGVNALIARKIDPNVIRSRTLDKLRPHREALVELIVSLARDDGISLMPSSVWSRLFPSHVYRLRPLHLARGGDPESTRQPPR
jgi:glycosyltransferase involved in cell wall biosynthesis